MRPVITGCGEIGIISCKKGYSLLSGFYNFANGKLKFFKLSSFMKKASTLILFSLIIPFLTFKPMAQQIIENRFRNGVKKEIVQTAGRQQLGEFAPEFAHLNDDILFGEVWSRNDLLSLRDRSLVTITSLISQGITDSSLTFHLQEAKKNGITRTEAAEIITHIAFYAGWPKAWAAFRLAKEVWNDDIKAMTPKPHSSAK